MQYIRGKGRSFKEPAKKRLIVGRTECKRLKLIFLQEPVKHVRREHNGRGDGNLDAGKFAAHMVGADQLVGKAEAARFSPERTAADPRKTA